MLLFVYFNFVISNMTTSETKNMFISKDNDKDKLSYGPIKKSTRKIKEISYYQDEKFTHYKRSKKQINNMTDEVIESKKAPPTQDEMRERNVESITNIFRKYIKESLDSANLQIDRENSRVTSLVKSMKNSFSLRKKVYVSNNMGFLVSSSDGKQTYNVEPKADADTLKYTCNCGTNYQDSERTSCKHCGAVIFYNFDNYLNHYLNNKQNIILQLHHLQNQLKKVDFEEEVVKADKMKITKEVEKEVPIEKDDTDFFSFILKNKNLLKIS